MNSGLSFGWLSIGSSARALNLADPAIRWAGAGLHDGGTLVYVTARPVGEDANELGLIAHGPDSSKLIGQINDLLHRWSQERPEQPAVTSPPTPPPHPTTVSSLECASPGPRPA